jgi:hypothetical protein
VYIHATLRISQFIYIRAIMSFRKIQTPDTGTGRMLPDVLDKRGYADRWNFSVRTIDNFLARSLPHLKIGKRRVRIEVQAADAWMREQFATQRRKINEG